MIFQKNVYLKLLVLKCVMVGVIRVISEGLTPTTSVVRRIAQSGYNLKVVSNHKNASFSTTQNKSFKMPSQVGSFQFISFQCCIRVHTY